jgi:peptidoglycan/LPS O-acetylase OafA/YrhL
MGVAHVCRADTAFAVRARRQNWGLLFLAAVAVMVLMDSVLKVGVYADKGIVRLVPGMSYYLVPFHWRWLPDVLGGLAFGALVVWLMQCRDGEAGRDGRWAGVGGWLLRLLESRPISTLGRMGYSVYLTHGFVVVMTWRMVAWLVPDQQWRFVASMSLGLVLTLLVGKAFHWAVERHFSPRD